MEERGEKGREGKVGAGGNTDVWWKVFEGRMNKGRKGNKRLVTDKKNDLAREERKEELFGKRGNMYEG